MASLHHCSPLMSSNGFTFLDVLCANTPHVHTYQKVLATPLNHSTITLEFHAANAHYSQVWMKWHIFVLTFTDQHTQQLFLALHKSSDCFHTLPTGTVPFIKEIYLELNSGEGGEWGKMSYD